MLGVADYDRYLAHMRNVHPGDRVMTETDFTHAWMNDRYNRPGTRCCECNRDREAGRERRDARGGRGEAGGESHSGEIWSVSGTRPC